MKGKRNAGWLGLALWLLPVVGLAQIDTGSIVGTVTDQTGAVIPGAKVVVMNNATGVSNTATTNGAGQYQILALVPGTYKVKAESPGMTPQVYDNIEIHVQSRQALDFSLMAGSSKQMISVTASEPLLQTQGAELGDVVAEKVIDDLPLNGRVYAQLAWLAAGAGKFYGSVSNAMADRFSVNGNSELWNYFALDGVANNSGSTNLQEASVQVVQPPPDALEEFKVQTRTYSAEFGTSAGAVVNVSTKSGTNQFHGDLWEFLRNDKLDANTFFNNANGVSRGRFSQNQYGGTIGGPILRNRTFFFADFQGFNSRAATTIGSVVPTPLMKQGNFTELPYQLSSVVSGQTGCSVGNIIQASCIDSTGKKLLSLYPDPNIPSAVANQGTPGSWTGGVNYQYQVSVPNDTYSTDARVDHSLNDNNKIFARYSLYHVDTETAPWTANALVGSSNFATATAIRGNSATTAWSDVISPKIFNEVRLGFSRISAVDSILGGTSGKSAGPDYGLTGIPNGPYTSGLPPISIGGVQGLGTSGWRPSFQTSQIYQLMDSLSWLKGNHSLKFGYQYYRSNVAFLDIEAPQGMLGASGIYTNTKGFGVADFLLGDMSSALFTTPLVPHNFRPGHALYAQDAWRATKRLTLNYGVRYELFAPLMDHNNQVANFSSANGGEVITPVSGASSWEARSLLKPNRLDFAPRLGVAYQLLERVVLRGGYGIFYNHFNRFGSESVLSLNTPFLTQVSLGQSLGSTTPVFILSNGFPAASLASTTVPLYSQQIRAQDPNQPTGYVEQPSFGTQVSISNAMALSVDYVGNFGHHLATIRNANQGIITGYDGSGNPIVAYPYANLNDTAAGQHAFLEYRADDGNTSYNGLQLSLQRRFSRGLGFGLNYTWSHSIADWTEPQAGGGTYLPQNAYNMAAERSNSVLDVRHRFTANFIWTLPIGQGGLLLNNNGRLGRFIGGWQANGIITLQTGNPFDIQAPDESGTGGNHASYANCIGDPFVGASSDPSAYVAGGSGFFINPASFSIPKTGHFGTCAPNSVHGPGLQNVDLSLFKSFQVTESKRLEFRSEFFNAFNHANFANPSADISNPGSFGKVYGTIGEPRQIQFALKLYF